MAKKQRHLDYENCPVEAALDLIGGKWKGVILQRLLTKTTRFNELKRTIPRITQRMLTSQLRDLEKDQLISRKIYAEIPPRVEYSATSRGQDLKPVISALANWGEKILNNKK